MLAGAVVTYDYSLELS